jgi:hypothetical protein
MNVDEAIAVFSSYSLEEKKEFLAQLIYELTLVARDSYEVGGEGLTNPQHVRRVNEAQHRLSAFLGKLLRDDPQRYPDDTLVKIVVGWSGDDQELGQQFLAAFAAAHRLTTTLSVG